MANPKTPFELAVASIREDEDPTATNRIKAATDVAQLYALAKSIVQTSMGVAADAQVPYPAIREVYREIHYLYEHYESRSEIEEAAAFGADEEE